MWIQYIRYAWWCPKAKQLKGSVAICRCATPPCFESDTLGITMTRLWARASFPEFPVRVPTNRVWLQRQSERELMLSSTGFNRAVRVILFMSCSRLIHSSFMSLCSHRKLRARGWSTVELRLRDQCHTWAENKSFPLDLTLGNTWALCK